MRKWLNNFPLKSAVAFTSLAALVFLYVSPIQADITNTASNESASPVFGGPAPAAWQTSYNRKALSATQTEFHGRWINYLAADDSWQTVDPSVLLVDGLFVMDKAPFTFRAPLRSTGEVEFEANNRYDEVEDDIINAPAVSSFTTALGVTDVAGTVQDLDGDGKKESVVYVGAYPALNADLVYTVHVGTRPTLQKLIRFNAAPPSDIDVQFSVRTSADLTIEVPDRQAVREVVNEEDSIETVKQKRLQETRSALVSWNGQKRSNVQNKTVTFRSADDAMRGFGFKAPRIWGSKNAEGEIKSAPLAYTLEQVADHYVLTKHVKAAFFTGATLPVYADTTTTVYPDPNPESTSVDGFVRYLDGATWAAAHDAVDGSSVSDTATDDIFATSRKDLTGLFEIYRGFFLFDTSALPDADVVSAATFSLYMTATSNGDNDGEDFVSVVVNANPESNTALVVGDYDLCGDAVDNPTEAHATDQRKDITGISTSAYTDWTLSATGIASVSLTGVTKFGVREGHDILDSAYAGSNNTSNYVNGSFADETGTSQDPKLVLTHTAAASAGDAAYFGRRAAADLNAVIE